MKLISKVCALALVLSVVGATPALAASQQVSIRDNFFDPKEVRIDPGDTVIWTNQGSRVHTVTADDKSFDSGDIRPGGNYSRTFSEEGYYFYHCEYHGGKGRVGQWGVVIVGDLPPPPEIKREKPARPKLVVPDDFPTIQKAVNAAGPGSTIVIKPGVYHEAVTVQTPRLVIRGVDRFRTVLHGRDKKNTGITVDGADHVTIKNLTVRNYTGNGVYIYNSSDYLVDRVDALYGRTYGVYAFESYRGVFRNSFAYGSGDGGFYVGGCLPCSALLENVRSERNYLGYSGTNATGVLIRDSIFAHNAMGVVPNTLPNEPYAPNRGTTIIDNRIVRNNYKNFVPAGFSETVRGPTGIGVYLFGVQGSLVRSNYIRHHDRYGVVATIAPAPDFVTINNRVRDNNVGDSGMFDLAWDGFGANNCFSNNKVTGLTGPPEIQTLYACSARPFVGIPFPIVDVDVVADVIMGHTRPEEEAPEPKRPRCQRGAPGCHRH